MLKWSFNMLLLNKLSDVLDISVLEIARRCGINQPVLYHYMKGKTELTVNTLIQMCNALRMPSRYFISENNHHIIPTRETATIESARWKPITWNRKEVELTFGDGEGKIYWKDVADVMHVTSGRPHDRFLLRTRFPISSFLLTCDHYNLSPFLFLNDPNVNIPIQKMKKKPTAPPSYEELSHKVDTLEHDIADLTKKFEALLRAHEALAKRVQVNIQNVHNSHIGINDHLDMAAENDPDER